jgi:membrane protein DedA with SNARE-associated domain/membrane-associated phospholipid phosphatase
MHLTLKLLDFATGVGSLWAYLLVLVTSFMEGLPLLGVFSPGGVAVAIAGFLAKIGNLNFFTALFVSTIAAFSGDLFGFALGQKYGYGFLKKYGRFFFLRDEHRVEKTRSLILAHPAKSLIFGRLYYLTRSISPFLAGASDVSLGVFFLYDLIGSFIWAALHVAIGFIFGQGFVAASHYLNYIILAAIALIVIIFYGYRFINKRHHAFKKYHVYTLAINLASIYIFSRCAEVVLRHRKLFSLDRYIYHHVPQLWNDAGIALMSGITVLGGFNCVSILIVLLFALLIYQKKRYYTILAFLSLLSGLLSEAFIKSITHVARPPLSLVSTEYWSFPSGHATAITLVGALFFHCFRKDIQSRWGRAFFGGGIFAIIAVVGFSRIYLNAHWFSDVFGGFALGMFWVTFYILAIRVIRIVEYKPLAFIKKRL